MPLYHNPLGIWQFRGKALGNRREFVVEGPGDQGDGDVETSDGLRETRLTPETQVAQRPGQALGIEPPSSIPLDVEACLRQLPERRKERRLPPRGEEGVEPVALEQGRPPVVGLAPFPSLVLVVETAPGRNQNKSSDAGFVREGKGKREPSAHGITRQGDRLRRKRVKERAQPLHLPREGQALPVARLLDLRRRIAQAWSQLRMTDQLDGGHCRVETTRGSQKAMKQYKWGKTGQALFIDSVRREEARIH